ncbi:pyrimidine-nucleoside phosphorylase [Lacrimispora xylanisolvens]|uniref:Pyrimidine-nucleoside phosphorylase n=1 Tax=Lacrimispora xylanisolvens TaxID=384636 RepID=A0A2S6HTG8_9FIRM|nr:pyrimidine-nucleoside phosphorylase [Hungatella xylanolytica]PPK81041.1 pyrimidine-nucleoside phosphorylase [Hungatella xylanolytica]
MRMYDLIAKKRNGETLTEEEIRSMIDGYVLGEIPDYQMSAMLMAIYFKGMSDTETAILTDAVAHSGDMVDLTPIQGIKVDKHSTGGVGDKTTLVVAPIVASCGVKVAKMSGRGLGHTGGTVDKLESIPGMRTTLTEEEFFEVVNTTGLSVIGQSGNLAPGDKKLYALRDVTATVESIPLIAASIMSKKLAAGSDCILLDVKTGSGAFMKTLQDSVTLAEKMVAIGEHAGKKTMALITNMDIPLGNLIGNSLEVIEAVETLKGRGPKDLTEVCLNLASGMLWLAGKGTPEECFAMAEKTIADGSALNRLAAMVKAQGGDPSVILDPSLFAKAPYEREINAVKKGYLVHMNTEQCGIASSMLGAGRVTKESLIDYTAGIALKKKVGQEVEEGETIAVLYTSRQELFDAAEEEFLKAVTIADEKPEEEPLIYARVTREGVKNLIG